VIAIIAVLISILLPGLAKARESARQTRCAVNIRQILTASILYANDSKERIPNPNFDTHPSGWLFTIQVNQMWSRPLRAGPATGVVWPYLGGSPALTPQGTIAVRDLIDTGLTKTYRCPSHAGPYTGTGQVTSYLFNGAVTAYGRRAVSFRLSQIPRQDAVLFWEADEEGGRRVVAAWNDGGSFPDEGLTKRHGRGATLAYLDGSTQWWTQQTFDEELLKLPGRLWWSPDSRTGQ
jgi:prepilin-type processing-associated H-X9-DG protein